MALIDDVRSICDRLAAKGWAKLFKIHGLDIKSADLSAELARELPGVDRSVPGFDDFAAEGGRGIEPGAPSRSLLYHALASMNVQSFPAAAGRPAVDLGEFPTLADLEVVENYVFSSWKPALSELTGLADGRPMAIVVFATEYRPGVDTVHRKHADLCFSRTGVARVGTDAPHYDPAARGFQPWKSGDGDHALRVLPAKYSAWIAVQSKGNARRFGPMRALPDDAQRDFWVPLYKLFDGDECIQGFDLKVSFAAHHVNEKLRRIHLEFARRGFDGGWRAPEIDEPPFRFTEGIAALSKGAKDGSGLLVPSVHRRLVDAAEFRGQPLTFVVPKEDAIQSRSKFLPTLEISQLARGVRAAPEYVHVRTAPGEAIEDLNELPDPAARVGAAGYRALHYVDYTGDGWVDVECPQLRSQFPRFIAAYSIVAAPDFFFNTDQRQLMEWWLQRAPERLRDFLWGSAPEALSDGRLPPNLKLNNVDFRPGDAGVPAARFRAEDETVTSIVGLPRRSPVRGRPLTAARRNRHNALPDGASGVFAPGWDVSLGRTEATLHLSAYGLGSPFPEDAKLCAALSAFWPSASPDAGRSFSRNFATVAPLTDEEIGTTGRLPWDGVAGPRVVAAQGAPAVVEYASFDHVDYVASALAGKFSIKLVGRISTDEYVARVLAMARAYRALGVQVPADKGAWRVLSFAKVRPSDADVQGAFADTGATLSGDLFRFEVFRPSGEPRPAGLRSQHVSMADRRKVLVGGDAIVLVHRNGEWGVVHGA
ncbi:MAG TPA: hypothetical protein VFS43_19525 [Polyangiaceae bacterium]|nr:hypothetical protein [Polyangiaceae bacterium]